MTWKDSDDGFVRLSLDAMLCLPMQHLLSGLEHSPHESRHCGMETAILGYSEWICNAKPGLSLGWDWRLSYASGPLGLVRVGSPRSNIMLIDRHGVDYGWQRNLDILSTVIDALPWRRDTTQALALRMD